MAELVDALASGASTRKGVEVRVFSWAPFSSFKIRVSRCKPLIERCSQFVHPTLINKFEHLMSIIQPANDDGEIYRQLVNRDRKLGDVCREIDNSLNGLMEDIEVKEVTDLDGAIAYALKNFRMTAYDQTNDCTDAVSSLADDLNVNIGSSLLRRMKNTS